MKAFRGLILASALGSLALPALAGDAKLGEEIFKKCRTCHSIIADDGTAIVKGGKTGPNLYGVVGRRIGSLAGFKYGDGIVAAGADGSVWDEAQIAVYVMDPTAFLKTKTANPAAISKMAFKLPKGGEDVAAYLASVKPAK